MYAGSLGVIVTSNKLLPGQRQAMEMMGYGKHGKPKSRLSTLPTPLGNPCGDSHIPTATAATIIDLKNRQSPPKTRN
jgi:hypothetical protein